MIDRKGAKGAPLKVAECIVGDASGVIVLIARNDQGRLLSWVLVLVFGMRSYNTPAPLAYVFVNTELHSVVCHLYIAVEVCQKGAYLNLKNAKVDMYRGSMRLAVDQAGKMEAAEGEVFAPKVIWRSRGDWELLGLCRS